MIESFHEGLIGRAAFEHLVGEVDARFLGLEAVADPDEGGAKSPPAKDKAR